MTRTLAPRPLAGRPLAGVLLAALALVGVLAAPASAAGRCRTTWGSLPEVSTGAGTVEGYVGNVRAGRHACFDRLVIDVYDGAGLGWWSVRYVPEVRTDGAGGVVPTRGGASLEVVLFAGADSPYGTRFPWPGRDPAELVDVRGFSTFRQVVWAGDFESTSTIGLGTRARLPFRVFTLPGPRGDLRLVVDVAHRW